MGRLALIVLASLAWLSPVQAQSEDLVQAYHEAFDNQDREALAEAFGSNLTDILYTIDRDLEDSLKLREQGAEEGGSVDEQAIARLHARALFGAEVASQVTGHPIFADYASAFVGWTPEQQRQFRAGQRAFGESRKAGGEGDVEGALASARRCLELAEPLGDWWGMAMGLSAMGNALQALDRHEEGLAALTRARIIHHDLGLLGSEMGNIQAMVASCMELGRRPRALATAKQGLALAKRVDHAPAVQEFGRVVESLQKRGG